jgi:hypothetical protein
MRADAGDPDAVSELTGSLHGLEQLPQRAGTGDRIALGS